MPNPYFQNGLKYPGFCQKSSGIFQTLRFLRVLVLKVYIYIEPAVRVRHFHPQTKTNSEDEFRRRISEDELNCPPRTNSPPKTNCEDEFPYIRANTSICPRLSAAIFVCAENVVKMRVFCIMANFMLYIGTHSIGTCASLLQIIIIIIKPLLKIFNECRSLTGVGELNPYGRSSMNVEV